MGIKLQCGYEFFEFLDDDEYLLPIRDKGMALRFLQGLRLESTQIADLRDRFLTDAENAEDLEDAQVLELLASTLGSGALRILRRPEVSRASSSGTGVQEEAQAGQTSAQPAAAPAAPKKARTHWIEFRVVEDKTGKPIEGVELLVKLPDGRYESHVTNSVGYVEINDIAAGACDARCDLNGALLSNTYNFIKNEQR